MSPENLSPMSLLSQKRAHDLGFNDRDWREKDENDLTFGQQFTHLLEEVGISRSELADRLYSSPFNQKADKPTGRDSYVTKLGRWAADKAVPDPEKREELFEICILAGFGYDRSRAFFEKTLHYSWVHMANRQDLIYLFCIQYGYDIGTAWALIHDRPEEGGAAAARGTSRTSMSIPALTAHIQSGYQSAMTLPQGFAYTAEERLEAFCDFLEENERRFHTVRMQRVKLFKSWVDAWGSRYVEEDTGEADELGRPILRQRKLHSNTELADLLRRMRVPTLTDVERMAAGGADAHTKKSRERIRGLLEDDKMGDGNPIRKAIPKYLSGETAIPRDIFIKTYILTAEAPNADDLDRALLEAGYPMLSLRAADGFDRLIYYVFTHSESEEENYRDYLDLVDQFIAQLREELEGLQKE